MARLGLLTIILSLLLSVDVAAQTATETTETAQDSTLRASVLTCYPGPEVFQLYGHTGIRVQYLDNDYVFNYGVFDFQEPNFVYRFVKGDAHYMLAAMPTTYFLHEYRVRNSKVVEQVLNIDANEAGTLVSLLTENAKPENRSYRYDYIYDNCSTRPRDIIERATGNSIDYGTPADSTLTFRQIMQNYETNYPWETFGIALALGYGIDQPISYRDYFFSPILYRNALDVATYENANGERVPLVSEVNILIDGPDCGSVNGPTPWYFTPMAFALIVMLISLWVTIHDMRNNALSRWFDITIYTLYSIAGVVIFFLIFISKHAATSPNLVGLWLNPIYLIPAAMLLFKYCRKVLYFYLLLNFTLLVILIIGGWCLPQYWSPAFYPLIIAIAARQFNYIIYYRKNDN